MVRKHHCAHVKVDCLHTSLAHGVRHNEYFSDDEDRSISYGSCSIVIRFSHEAAHTQVSSLTMWHDDLLFIKWKEMIIRLVFFFLI